MAKVVKEPGGVKLDPRKKEIKLNNKDERIMPRKEVKKYVKELQSQGISVKMDLKGKILSNPENVAGFDSNTGTIYIRKNPTIISALHEKYHAELFLKLGKEDYQKQTRLQREEYVYQEIINNRHLFNDAEIYASQRYIFSVRKGYWPLPDWKGYDD